MNGTLQNTILNKYIAGVAPETAGWSTYHVLPKEAFLTAIKVVVNSVKGNIAVDIKKKISEYSLHLSSPLNTKAIVGIPKGSFSKLNSIQVNGTTIRNGNYSGGVTGITWNGEDDKYVKFNADPGRWAFMAAGILPISSPKPLRAPRPKQTKLDKKTWAVSASITNTEPKMSYRWGKKTADQLMMQLMGIFGPVGVREQNSQKANGSESIWERPRRLIK